MRPFFEAIFGPLNEVLGAIPLSAARWVTVGFLLLAVVVTLRLKADYVFLGSEGREWYRDLRRFGTVPHAGFGMGLERVVAWICGLQHVRETIPFPRLLGRLRP